MRTITNTLYTFTTPSGRKATVYADREVTGYGRQVRTYVRVGDQTVMLEPGCAYTASARVAELQL